MFESLRKKWETTKGMGYMLSGMPFQFLFLGSLVYYKEQLGPYPDVPPAIYCVSEIGFWIFMFYLFRLYFMKRKGLITTGFYRFTRHPMYTGTLLFAIRLWWPFTSDLTFTYCTTLTLFLIGIITAGYLQEKETLARFGQDAEEYYKRTPRLFLWYPFMRPR